MLLSTMRCLPATFWDRRVLWKSVICSILAWNFIALYCTLPGDIKTRKSHLSCMRRTHHNQIVCSMKQMFITSISYCGHPKLLVVVLKPRPLWAQSYFLSSWGPFDVLFSKDENRMMTWPLIAQETLFFKAINTTWPKKTDVTRNYLIANKILIVSK